MGRADKRADKSPRKLLDEFRQTGADETDDIPSMTDREYVEMMLRKERARRNQALVSKKEQPSTPVPSGSAPQKLESRQSRQLPAALDPLKHDVLDSEANAKRKALETLAKHRKDTLPPQRIGKVQKPAVSERVSPMKLCGNCYYCSDKRQVGGSWWCRCTNAGRSTSLTTPASGWVKGKINLPCWRPIGESAANPARVSEPDS